MNHVPKTNDITQLIEADRAHVWHHLSQHKAYDTVDSQLMIEGRGMRVWDAKGREYLNGHPAACGP